MRKKFHIKRRSCGLCKPHKKGWENRWTASEHQLLIEFDSIKRNPAMPDPVAPEPERLKFFCM